MIYNGLSIFLILVGLLAIYLSLKLLLRNNWFLGWLRGMFGFALLILSATIAFSAVDLYSYKQLGKEDVIATISFSRIAEQEFKATLVSNDGKEETYTLYGDQWQLDARILKWKGFASRLGIPPCYRLDRISGRYYDLDQERNATRAVFAVKESLYNVDLWQWISSSGDALPILDAQYGSATFVPMADGALFQVSLTTSGLVSRPLNDAATDAVGQW